MKKINIFLASSIHNCLRKKISSFNVELNSRLISENNVYLYLYMCENEEKAICQSRTQDVYNAFIKNKCEIFLALIESKVGEFTKEEIEMAIEAQKNRQLKLVIVYHPVFKKSPYYLELSNNKDIQLIEIDVLENIKSIYKKIIFEYLEISERN